MDTTFSPSAGPAPTPFGSGAPTPRRSVGGATLGGLFLIALGLFFIARNVFSLGGETVLLAIGSAFVVGRFVTDRPALAVPGGILLGLGTFLTLQDAGAFVTHPAGWFFALLGAGFLLSYAIALRPAATWPLVPGVLLIGLGLVLQGSFVLPQLLPPDSYRIVLPALLVLFGAWMLVRESVPAPLRQTVGAVGSIGVPLVAVLSLASAFTPGALWLSDLPRFASLPFGGMRMAAYNESVTLAAPAVANGSLRIVNPNGRTVVRTGAADEVRVTADTHYWEQGSGPEVRLQEQGGSLTLDATTSGIGPRSSWVDYTVVLPAGTSLAVEAASGSVDVTGVMGPVTVNGASGRVTVADVRDATLRTASGSVTARNVAGELRATTASGSIRATNVAQPRELRSTSGSVTLEGVFAGSTHLETTSGSVRLELAPESSTRIDVTTGSGSIKTDDLSLANKQEQRRSLQGTLGSGTGTLTVRTGSGSVTLDGR